MIKSIAITCFAVLTFGANGQSLPGESSTRMEMFDILASRVPHVRSMGLPDKCGLPALTAAIHDRGHLSPAEKVSLENLLQRPPTQKNILRGNFRVHYDTVGTHRAALLDNQGNPIPNSADAFADSVAAIINHVAQFQHDSLGFLLPPSDLNRGGGPEFDIYVVDLGSMYGQTSPDSSIDNLLNGGRFATFIEIDNDFIFVSPPSNRGLPALRVTLAHEFQHAVQLGSYGYWTGDVYFYEMSSVWMEDEIFTEVNDYYQYLRSSLGHFRRPDLPFTSNDFVMYSRGIWGIFVGKRFGPAVMRAAWEGIRLQRPLSAMDDALQGAGSSFRLAFAEWTLWNHFTGYRADNSRFYDEGSAYPLMTNDRFSFSPPSATIAATLLPFGTRYHQILQNRPTSGVDSLYFILSNINLSAALQGNYNQFPYSALLNTQQLDNEYLPLGSRLFVKLDVADEANWYSWRVDTMIVAPQPPAVSFEIRVGPNPFITGGTERLRFRAASGDNTVGTLTILASSADLVYQRTGTATRDVDANVFHWDGVTDKGEDAPSGVYFYILEVGGRTVTGKFALIRK